MSAGEDKVEELGRLLYELTYDSAGGDLEDIQDKILALPEEERKRAVNWRNPANKNRTVLIATAFTVRERVRRQAVIDANLFQIMPAFTKEDAKWHSDEIRWLLKAGADATLHDDDGADIFTAYADGLDSWGMMRVLAELPSDRLPHTLRYLSKHHRDGEDNCHVHFENLADGFQEFLVAEAVLEKELEEEAKQIEIQRAIENDRRKRGCCTNCGHKDEGEERPAKKKK